MFSTTYGDFDGDSWESFCKKGLNMKHDDYQHVPATEGDMGIEGYTRDGTVFQCYCPDDNTTTDDLYTKQRNKINKDLNKLVKYEKDIKKHLKGITIKKWILLTPEYRDKKILKYAAQKCKEFRELNLDYLDKEFDIFVKDIDFFSAEISIILEITKSKINIKETELTEDLTTKSYPDIEEIQNLKSKVEKTLHFKDPNKIDKALTQQIDLYIKSYLTGVSIISEFERISPHLYEKFIAVIDDFELYVQEQGIYSEDNRKYFLDIKSELTELLLSEFASPMDRVMIQKLSRYTISDWLMRCPLDFYN
ncbi:hypothetical protein [Alteribacter keqinensis]|uniref:Uncharacterized protein n=1 Tax=Alteribacter keqinensis TaxID=2483800 RepID=A0A3M7TT49_9BACI|nr:hypothetical protein [Alteribacter keqinensis]RNA68796.1 hypothetical protein EBO34_02190 [Alteribacter keqinensis]